MRGAALGLVASLVLGGAAWAQSTTTGPGTPPTSGTPAIGSDAHGASGSDNQAVATTNANAATPAHGHNSFTRGEARRRIGAEGYKDVTGLRLVRGVWRGEASRNGQSTGVWLDYKGNVGASGS